MGWRTHAIASMFAVAVAFDMSPAVAADAAFTQFIASLWPEAQAAGVSRQTFDRETRGLEPDYKLPDLILPGRPATGAPSQAPHNKRGCSTVTSTTPSANVARSASPGRAWRTLVTARPSVSVSSA